MFTRDYNRLQRIGWNNIKATIKYGDDPTKMNYLRGRGVSAAKQYEIASVKYGGGGITRKWSYKMRRRLLSGEGIGKWFQGHHRMNVHYHPQYAAEGNNISFYTPEEHFDAHGKNWKNETDAPLIEKDSILVHQFSRSMLRRELMGAGFAAAVGFASTMSLSLIVDCSQNGIDLDAFKQNWATYAKQGVKGAGVSAAYYGGFRIGSELIDKVIAAAGSNIGEKTATFLKSNGGKMAIIGGVIIAAEGCWDVKKDLDKGETWGYALSHCAKKQSVPVALLGLSAWQPEIGIPISILYGAWQVGMGILDGKTAHKVEFHRLYHEHKLITASL